MKKRSKSFDRFQLACRSHYWFDRLKASHTPNKVCLGTSPLTLGSACKDRKVRSIPTQPPQASDTVIPQMPTPTLGYDLIPLQRSEVNNSLNVAFEVDCQTDITIDGQGTVDIATEATQKNGQEFTPPSTPTMKRSHQLKGVMHWEMFQNNNQSDVWAKMHWQDGGSKIDLPIEMDDQHRYATFRAALRRARTPKPRFALFASQRTQSHLCCRHLQPRPYSHVLKYL